MTSELSRSELVKFLILSKRKTYASGGSDSQASVDAVLENSHQLEFRSGKLLYRDIYFGEAFFAGHEIVYHGEDAIWSMCYVGGWTDKLTDLAEVSILGEFLQSALQQVPQEHPFRGPLEHYEAGRPYKYKNNPNGDIDKFKGVEYITRDGVIVYELNYCGGRLR